MLKKIYKNNQFNPQFPAGVIFNPFYLIRRELYKSIKNFAGIFRGDIIDIGCGIKPYRHLFSCESYIGLDIDNPGHNHENENIDIFYDGINLPFNDNSKDGALCFEVFEHVFDLEPLLNEIHRVLKTNGNIFITTPLLFGEHETPSDFGRFSSYGLTYILKKNGFEVTEFKKILNGPEVIFVILNHYLYSLADIGKKTSIFLLIVTFPVFILFNFLSILFSLLPRNKNIYFGNVVIAKKV